MVDKKRVLKLLGSGLSAEVVATTIGCDPSYISQLLSDDSFREQVTEERIKTLTSASIRDEEYNKIEDRLLKKLSDQLDFIVKPRDLLLALSIINKAERRGAKPQEQTVINNQIVNLTLPQQAVTKFILNGNKQVVAIETEQKVQSMVTLDSSALPKLLEIKQTGQQNDSARLSSGNSPVSRGEDPDSAEQRLLDKLL